MQELTRSDWDALRKRNPARRLRCNGRLKVNPCQELVFVCRSAMDGTGYSKVHRGFACRRYCCACEGSGEENRCARCSNRLAKHLEKKGRKSE